MLYVYICSIASPGRLRLSYIGNHVYVVHGKVALFISTSHATEKRCRDDEMTDELFFVPLVAAVLQHTLIP